MIREVSIENYKSIEKLKLSLGRINIFIGENGCGKTNILEAIALAAAAASNKLDNEFLVSRGIRVTEPRLMRSAFDSENSLQEIKIQVNRVQQIEERFKCVINNDNDPYSNWTYRNAFSLHEESTELLRWSIESDFLNVTKNISEKELLWGSSNVFQAEQNYLYKIGRYFDDVGTDFRLNKKGFDFKHYLIFSPHYSSLRLFEKEGQIQPLGINGEGLFKLLQVTARSKSNELSELHKIKKKMKLIDWFEDFDIPQDLYATEKRLKIKDRYLNEELAYFDQRSSNEGFLFLLFYFALFVSEKTPNFFAVDNIDASLNPRLGRRLIQELVELAEEYEKQAILTTHNPAILDGLNLEDDEQRLFVIYRNKLGHTKARRIFNPEPLEGQKSVKLSEAFLRGYIGGLPKNF
ncbi:MAG: AAA family ATPase [Cyanobacteriota bacterium]|nr:AAA family ATPase [Cyanobacteriota bacterium]